jgi:hypothetical protein
MRPNIGRSITAETTERTPRSRITPIGPVRGRMPGPTGGSPGDRRNGVNGENTAHGRSPASAADIAPQQLASMISASGRTSAMAAARSPSNSARRHSTSMVIRSTPNTVRAVQSGCGSPRSRDRRPRSEAHRGARVHLRRHRSQVDVVAAAGQLAQRQLTSGWPSAGAP